MTNKFSTYSLTYFFVGVVTLLNAQTTLDLKTCQKYPMMYYVSFPKGHNSKKKLPVLVVLEAAEKQFKENAQRFVDARGDLPYIIVAPINVNNGFQGRKDPTLWPYPAETWTFIEKVGDCTFNQEGILAVAKEVSVLYGGDDRFYVTGFEAGTHALWPLVFQHPERLKGAVAVAGNYNQRTCISTQVYSKDPARLQLPVVGMYGENDPVFGDRAQVFDQWLAAKKMATEHGFQNVTEKKIAGKDHVPMPTEVFEVITAIELQLSKQH